MTLTDDQAERLAHILIANSGDHRQCPTCSHAFVPNDETAQETFELYQELFGRKSAA